MQKKLIALAIAGLASGAAFAQTNVTMYGIADAGYIYSSGGSNSFNLANPRLNNVTDNDRRFSGIQSGILSVSRLGFKGSEALGNGLKAIFTLEYSLNIDDNSGVGSTGGLNARQQFVGLQSDKLGTVAFGRQYAPGYMASVNNDPLGGSVLGSQSILSAQAGNTITPNSAARWNNGMTYTSPNFSGFTGKLIYAFGEEDVTKSADNGGMFGIGGNYANGPLNIDLVYQTRQNVVYAAIPASFSVAAVLPPTVPPTTTITGRLGTPAVYSGKDINEGYIGGSYDFKVAKVMGSYQSQNDKTAVNNDNTVWTLGVIVPVMAASNITASYGQLDLDRGSLFDGKTNTVTLGWTTAMSKRTTLYAGYVWIDNDDYSLPVRSGGVPAGVGALGQSNNTVAAGIRHTF